MPSKSTNDMMQAAMWRQNSIFGEFRQSDVVASMQPQKGWFSR